MRQFLDFIYGIFMFLVIWLAPFLVVYLGVNFATLGAYWSIFDWSFGMRTLTVICAFWWFVGIIHSIVY